jgi:hypothetical protein
MELTSVAISPNRKLVCIVINRFITMFFTTTESPVQVGSVTFSTPVCVDFRSDDAAMVLTDRGRLMHITGLHQRTGDLRAFGNHTIAVKSPVTAISLQRSQLYIGTASGQILAANMIMTPYRVNEVRQLRFGVASVASGPRGSVLVRDDRHNYLFLTAEGEWLPLPRAVKNAVICSPIAFLCRIPGEGSLRVVQLVGAFTPMAPVSAVRCIVLHNRKVQQALHREHATVETCRQLGLAMMGRILTGNQFPERVTHEMTLLRNVCMQTTALVGRAIRLSLYTKDFITARGFMLATDPADPKYLVNMMKAAMIGSRDGEESLKLVTSSLIGKGFVDDALDIMLMGDHWKMTAQTLLGIGRVVEAALICRVQPDGPEKKEMMEKVARKMNGTGMKSYAALMFGEAGIFGEVAVMYRSAGQNAQADFLIGAL